MNSQRTYLISIVSTLKGLKGFDNVFKIYYNKMMEMNKELKNNNTKSETQLKNWISQDEIIQIYNELKNKAEPLFSLKKITSKEWDTILNYVILSLYVLQAPRRNIDYQKMLVNKTSNFENNEDYKNFNYYIYPNQKFLFFCYKTAGTYNMQEFVISDDLQKILLKYLKIHPLRKENNYYLLVNSEGDALTSINSITRILNKIFNRKIGSSMLRNIYLTDKYKDEMNEMNDDAHKMGTSTETIKSNYVKFD
jgi:hypothetical protein